VFRGSSLHNAPGSSEVKGARVAEPIEQIIKSAIQNQYPHATAITLVEVRALDERSSLPDYVVRARWTSDEVTQIGQFLVKVSTSTDGAAESALLPALAAKEIPVPRVLLAEPSDYGSYIVQEHLSGRPISQSLVDAAMRWELSALGFTYGRLLAQIHSLAWAEVVPWLGDAEAAPESIVEDQLDAWRTAWEEQFARIPEEYLSLCEEALAWLDERRPDEVSLCLCHGDYRPTQVQMAGDDVLAILGWDNALVTDASYDLALMPFDIRKLGLPAEDSDLLHQAIIGSYLQASSRAIGNLPFYAVARLLSAGLEALAQGERAKAPIPAFSSDVDELFAAMREVMSEGRKPLWRA
jgi:aminoglycoside phosphotransferase (APT) family kinase protein